MPDLDTATLEALLAEVTPGKWRKHGNGAQIVTDEAWVATLPRAYRSKPNSRLIAMAPDLARKVIAQAAQIERLRAAAEALGALPEGYCFCSKHRIGDDSKIHEPECADLRAALQSEVSHG